LRIENRPVQFRKVAVPHRVARYRRQERLPLPLPMRLVRPEEERLVLEDRPADRAAKLILLELRFRASGPVVEEGVRVKRRVAMELERASGQLVRSRFDLQVDDAAERSAEFSRVRRGL